MVPKVAVSSRIQLLGSAWTRAFRCVWMLEELGIPYENIDVAPGDMVKSFNASGKVPVLVEFDSHKQQDPSFIMYESSAINTYLADRYGGVEKNLIPPPDAHRERALYDQTIQCIMTELDAQALWVHRKNVGMPKKYGSIPETGIDGAEQNFSRMNHHLSKQLKPYLLGENFTAADILYVHCLDWSKSIGWHTDWPTNVQPYRELCHQRPAYQTAKAMRDRNKDDRKQQMKQNNQGESGKSNL